MLPIKLNVSKADVDRHELDILMRATKNFNESRRKAITNSSPKEVLIKLDIHRLEKCKQSNKI